MRIRAFNANAYVCFHVQVYIYTQIYTRLHGAARLRSYARMSCAEVSVEAKTTKGCRGMLTDRRTVYTARGEIRCSLPGAAILPEDHISRFQLRFDVIAWRTRYEHYACDTFEMDLNDYT